MAKLMMPSVYDALLSAGADDEKARSAAIDVANYDDRIVRVESRLGALAAKLDLLQWMVGVNIAATLAILIRVFS